MSSEFWLISVPGDRENLQILERMNNFTSKSNLSRNTDFLIPDFKMGTLDSLLSLSDELGELGRLAESLMKRMTRMTRYVLELKAAKKGEVQEYLFADGVTLASFVTHFEWDLTKYPVKQPLGAIADTLGKELAQVETDLKSSITAYSQLKRELENMEKKLLGSLFTRTVSDIVRKEDFVLDSKYLITLLVVVPKASYSLWQKTYESLSDMVVPRSTKLIAEDQENGLFTVTIFQKAIDDFKAKATANKFTVRDFFYDEKQIQSEREELTKLLSAKKQQKSPFLHWLKVNFGKTLLVWIHIAALSIFAESSLRYGLPVNFKAVLLHPQKKSRKRLRKILNSTFKHLDAVAASMVDTPVNIPGLQLSNEEYFPYVCFNIRLKFLD
ncbi:V-type proton ATPase subunit C 2-like isoform X2 [Vombatus ursinus]|uniref:V-type proton ATPase subunit C 2-like isoform X2 n=1 Tax=Vombatus ursinus TaxID=29139 RepID=UPI000FFCE5A5|nr:V-type proton ATPase subunit C 2-like isoform X2 [Vombatus ursinus]